MSKSVKNNLINKKVSDYSSARSHEKEILVRVDNVSKRFCRDFKRSLIYGAKDIVQDLVGGERESAVLRKDEFYANRGISFELRRGDCLGLIGHNGAGKTTLLKMLNGLIKPDAGRIEMRGRIGALIALGAGFNPILTGRENVFIAGSVLGLSKNEIREKYDEIVDFAEVEDFMDTPLQNYSSGMQVRLGFAVASSLEPDILLIDEVLAVGDIGFRTKCYNKISRISKDCAIIFVSHQMPQVERLCDVGIVLESGKQKFEGSCPEAINHYNKLFESNFSRGSVTKTEEFEKYKCLVEGKRDGSNVIFAGGGEFEMDLRVFSKREYSNVEVSVNINQPSGEIITQINSHRQKISLKIKKGENKVSLSVPKLQIGSGAKSVSVRIIDCETSEILLWDRLAEQVLVTNEPFRPTPSYEIGIFSIR